MASFINLFQSIIEPTVCIFSLPRIPMILLGVVIACILPDSYFFSKHIPHGWRNKIQLPINNRTTIKSKQRAFFLEHNPNSKLSTFGFSRKKRHESWVENKPKEFSFAGKVRTIIKYSLNVNKNACSVCASFAISYFR